MNRYRYFSCTMNRFVLQVNHEDIMKYDVNIVQCDCHMGIVMNQSHSFGSL
jgi:hypothetical protein